MGCVARGSAVLLPLRTCGRGPTLYHKRGIVCFAAKGLSVVLFRNRSSCSILIFGQHREPSGRTLFFVWRVGGGALFGLLSVQTARKTKLKRNEIFLRLRWLCEWSDVIRFIEYCSSDLMRSTNASVQSFQRCHVRSDCLDSTESSFPFEDVVPNLREACGNSGGTVDDNVTGPSDEKKCSEAAVSFCLGV